MTRPFISTAGGALGAVLGLLLASGAGSAVAAEAPVYDGHVKCEETADGKVCKIDVWLTRGFRAFSQCQVCHGLDANGSSFAPSLVAALKEIDQVRFLTVVANGYKGQVGVMPPWRDNPNVMNYVGQLYAYLKARSDGVLPPGKIERYDR